MNAQKARPIPEGYHSVTPFVIARGAARFLDFMAEAFDAREIARVVGEDGKIGHAETRIGDSVVMTFDARQGWPETPAFLRLYVEDLSPEEMEPRYGEQKYIDAMEYVQSAEFFPSG